MINTTCIQAFVDTAENLFYEYGNCGRKIRRFLDRNYIEGSARFQVSVPYAHLLQFAYGVGQMQWATQMAQDSADCDMADGPMFAMKFSVEAINATAGTLDIVVTPEEIPGSVKERQEFLKRVAHGLRRYVAIAELGFAASNLDEFFQDLFGMPGATEQIDTAQYLAKFDKLVASNYTELADTPSYVVALAEYLNPDVTLELARMQDEYDKVVDAAFAHFAMPSSTARHLRFAKD